MLMSIYRYYYQSSYYISLTLLHFLLEKCTFPLRSLFTVQYDSRTYRQNFCSFRYYFSLKKERKKSRRPVQLT